LLLFLFVVGKEKEDELNITVVYRFLSFGSFDQAKEQDKIPFITFSLMRKQPKNLENPRPNNSNYF